MNLIGVFKACTFIAYRCNISVVSFNHKVYVSCMSIAFWEKDEVFNHLACFVPYTQYLYIACTS